MRRVATASAPHRHRPPAPRPPDGPPHATVRHAVPRRPVRLPADHRPRRRRTHSACRGIRRRHCRRHPSRHRTGRRPPNAPASGRRPPCAWRCAASWRRRRVHADRARPAGRTTLGSGCRAGSDQGVGSRGHDRPRRRSGYPRRRRAPRPAGPRHPIQQPSSPDPGRGAVIGIVVTICPATQSGCDLRRGARPDSHTHGKLFQRVPQCISIGGMRSARRGPIEKQSPRRGTIHRLADRIEAVRDRADSGGVDSSSLPHTHLTGRSADRFPDRPKTPSAAR